LGHPVDVINVLKVCTRFNERVCYFVNVYYFNRSHTKIKKYVVVWM